MRKKNALTRSMLQTPATMADLINGFVFHGKQIVRADELTPLDTASVAAPFGLDGKKVLLERFRDAKSLWRGRKTNAMFSIFATEHQTGVHYAMPVRELVYDAVDLTSQVDQKAKSHKKELKEQRKDPKKDRRRSYAPNSGEFLGGFWKTDRITPVYTITLFLSPDSWDGPRSIREMYSETHPEVLAGCVDYKLNILVPAELSDEQICSWFQTDLREVLLLIKYSNDKGMIQELLEEGRDADRFDKMSRTAAELVQEFTGIPIPKNNAKENGTVIMRQAAKDLLAEGRAEGRAEGEARGEARGIIETSREFGADDDTIVHSLIQKMHISEGEAHAYLQMFSSQTV